MENEIVINGVTYLRKKDETNLKWVIVRTYSAGVFYGQIESQVGQEVVLKNARRMWQWFGASLSECAQSGTPDKSKCKFPEKVDEIKLLQVIEIINLTEKALKSLEEVNIWKA